MTCAAIIVAAAGAPAGGPTAPAANPPYVWWEGEATEATNFSNRSWFRAERLPNRDGLSAGNWLNNDGNRLGPELFARYAVQVPQAGRFQFWTRKFWKHGPFRWRFDEGDWRTCGRDVGLADTFVFETNVCANWVHLGEVDLAAGAHRFELRLLAGEGASATACFDVFLLIAGPFSPRGRLRPGEKSGLSEPGWWAFEPAPDAFGPAVLDLRSLNEKTAGESGFVGRRGNEFVLGDGQPVRFWGVNAGPGIVRLDRGSIDYLARRLAKVGVNIVRFHGPVFDQSAADPAAIDTGLLDRLHFLLAALKAQGIYVKLSFYFPLWFDVKPSYGIPGYETIENKRPFALLAFDPRMQTVYRAWAKALLTTRNPYTGLPPATDPAVAMVEIVNEDSYLFWTFAEKNIPRIQMEKLERAFGAWLAAKYGSVDKALSAWGPGAGQKTDAAADGRAAVLDVWHLTAQGHGEGPKRRRMSDQLQFLTEHQRGFYAETIRFFREDLGLKSLVSCSNWHTADPQRLDALERYTYTVGDVIDRHGYFGGRHTGPRAGYAVSTGDTFTDRAAVLEPAAPPIAVNQVEGFPHIVSEIGWTNPNRFRADAAPLCAAYGAFQGIDGWFFFALSGADWSSASEKFPVNVPAVLGQFPAAALLYRRGYVREGDVVVHEALSLRDLYDFKGSAAVAPPGLDALRQADVPLGGERRGVPVGAIDPLAFFVGRVSRGLGEDPSKAVLRDLSPFIDRRGKTVRSATGELRWDYGTGLVTLNAARTQAATGFLGKAGRVELTDVTIESANEFGTVLVTSLDGLPIAASKRLLVQAMTEEKPFGWKVEGGRIVSLGGHPMLVRNVEATVTLKRHGGLTQVRTLDEHGYGRPSGSAPLAADGRLRLAPDALYTVIE